VRWGSRPGRWCTSRWSAAADAVALGVEGPGPPPQQPSSSSRRSTPATYPPPNNRTCTSSGASCSAGRRPFPAPDPTATPRVGAVEGRRRVAEQRQHREVDLAVGVVDRRVDEPSTVHDVAGPQVAVHQARAVSWSSRSHSGPAIARSSRVAVLGPAGRRGRGRAGARRRTSGQRACPGVALGEWADHVVPVPPEPVRGAPVHVRQRGPEPAQSAGPATWDSTSRRGFDVEHLGDRRAGAGERTQPLGLEVRVVAGGLDHHGAAVGELGPDHLADVAAVQGRGPDHGRQGRRPRLGCVPRHAGRRPGGRGRPGPRGGPWRRPRRTPWSRRSRGRGPRGRRRPRGRTRGTGGSRCRPRRGPPSPRSAPGSTGPSPGPGPPPRGRPW
jgi:hypothetical protein